MPSPLPENSAARGTVLIAALAGRALAEAARESGYRPLVADLFGDEDTRELAEAVEVVDGDFDNGFVASSLVNALERLSAGRTPVGLAYGAGFEADPGLLAALESRWPVLGNTSSSVAALKDPMNFAALCARIGILHPETATAIGGDPAGWLCKRRGGSGGGHIQLADKAARTDYYFQKRIDGVPVSALFLADGKTARIIGWTRQWCSPTEMEPYRYGGAAHPAGIDASTVQPLETGIAALTRELGLRGLNSADYILSGAHGWLLEINPRPGATLDVIRGQGLFQAHVEACQGQLTALAGANGKSRAAAIAYAGRDIPAVPALDWPVWARDRQSAGTSVKKGDPLCTVLADAESTMDAIATTQARIHLIRGQIDGAAA
jgi:predicted ATP-grasp superfamily ATP-dependent carboligase